MVIFNRREREMRGGGRQELRELENKRRFKGKTERKGRATEEERDGGRGTEGWRGGRVITEALCHRCSTLQ